MSRSLRFTTGRHGAMRPQQRGFASATRARASRPGPTAGLTLMEVLIAITLLSLLSVGLLMAMRIGLNTFIKAKDSLMADRRVAGAQRILEQEIAGMVPVVAGCEGAGVGGGVRLAFFQGEAQAMRLVSTFSLQGAWRSAPQILELTVIRGENGRGVRLVVNEVPYEGPSSAGRLCIGYSAGPGSNAAIPRYSSVQAGPKSFVLADKLEYCRFSYFSPPARPGMAWSWMPEWAANDWPRGVRIEMAPLEPGLARLQPISVTVPVRILRSPMVFYADQ
jgi:type II secretory pathway component PulJ